MKLSSFTFPGCPRVVASGLLLLGAAGPLHAQSADPDGGRLRLPWKHQVWDEHQHGRNDNSGFHKELLHPAR